MFSSENIKVAIIGLGYVGLSLSVVSSRKYPVTGFDINNRRITELAITNDSILELSDTELVEANQLVFSSDKSKLKKSNV